LNLFVSVETWDRANTIVNTYSFKAPRSKNKIYPTTGLILCGNCGKVQGCNYHPHIDKLYIKVCRCRNRKFYYNDVLTLIKQEILTHKETILRAISHLDNDSERDNTQYRIESLRKAIQKAEKALDKIEILFEEDEITLPQYRERKGKRTEEMKSLQEEHDQVMKENPTHKRKLLEDYLRIIDELFDNWEILDGDGLSNEQINRRLHLLIKGIVWRYPKNAKPSLRIIYNTIYPL
jgi:site-specific DNA recombinase